jgi:hypothetical protein
MLWSISSVTTHYNIVTNNVISVLIQYGRPLSTMDAILSTIVINAARHHKLDYS